MDDATIELSVIVEQLAALALTAKALSKKPLFELERSTDADQQTDLPRPTEKAIN